MARIRIQILVLMVCALVAGCGGSGSPENKELVIGNIGWDENVAVSNLTKIILEEDLGYEKVELQTEGVDALFRGVSSGDLDAFQDVWLPNHDSYLDGVAGDVEQLDPWYKGTTKFSLAVPTYVKTRDGEDVRSIAQLDETSAQQIIGIEPDAVIMENVPRKVIPAYGLDQQLIEAPTPGMLAEVQKRYNARQPFAFVAWSPHWMNEAYDFNYLEDPKGALGTLTRPAELSTIVRKDLESENPVAYAFMDELTLTENQVNSMEAAIQENGQDPALGVNVWLEQNRGVVEPWIYAARQAEQR